jgi:dipeptidyl aminopeptidase/acylaminoacyl peptidase
MPEATYGSWKSPITADLILAGAIGLGQVIVKGADVYWIEGRPAEGGRNVIVHQASDGTTREINPAPMNARTRVHEYGGGDLAVGEDGTVYFANFADQQIYVGRPGSAPVQLTHEPGMRYADFVVDGRRGRLVGVREDHTLPDREAVNTIVAIDTTTGDETVLVSGHDFFSNPRLSPDCTQIAWVAWDHPNMPWDGSELNVARLDDDGRPQQPRVVAGRKTESIFQPEWSPGGTLYFVSDGNGWGNLYRWTGGAVEPVAPMVAEFGQPQWVFGMSTYDFDSEQRLVCAYGEQGRGKLGMVHTATGVVTAVETLFSSFGRSLRVSNGRAYFVGGSPTRSAALVAVDLNSGKVETIKKSTEQVIDPGYISEPQTIEFPTEEGKTAFAFFYPPRNKDFSAPAGEKPPLLVMSHGGPTAATAATLTLGRQFWTSRGIAVLDVNYGGSTGYGREYRERLNGRWGIVDVDDSINGARYLAERGLVDGNRLAITGGSAGGYTTLAVLTFRDAFKAGASHYGVGDLEALARDTHKFESRYLDGLIGPYPERRDLYVERSPIHHVDQLNSPAIFFQGLEDEIVPPNQAETMVEALRRKGVPVAYLPFEGEQHGFRRSENIKRSLEAELYFYSRVFGFDLADPIEPVEIENLRA